LPAKLRLTDRETAKQIKTKAIIASDITVIILLNI
jgi:hypothetical protein